MFQDHRPQSDYTVNSKMSNYIHVTTDLTTTLMVMYGQSNEVETFPMYELL